MISACGQKADDLPAAQYKELGWLDLEPISEQTPADKDSRWVVNGSYVDEDELNNSDLPAQEYSVGVVSELDGQKVRVPGYVVPVEFESENLVTEFFLVPYFGACFHYPPPPPNQRFMLSAKKRFIMRASMTLCGLTASSRQK